MKDNHNIRIVVRPVEGQEGEYQASYVSEFLQAEFCVTVKDSIFGALALQTFSEMIRKAFGKHYRSGQGGGVRCKKKREREEPLRECPVRRNACGSSLCMFRT